MKKELKWSSYILWRTRVENCKTKNSAKRSTEIDRFKAHDNSTSPIIKFLKGKFMEAKKPDNVVYSETEDYNAKLMTYATRLWVHL
jgi:hypothetical protein